LLNFNDLPKAPAFGLATLQPFAMQQYIMNAIPPNPDLAGAILRIDLAALRHNYKTLMAKSGTDCGAAIKGEAYGIGMKEAGAALWQAGCRTFFVARPEEGSSLRKILPQAAIYVLDGLYPKAAAYYVKHKLRPALTSLAQAEDWASHGKGNPCALHVDTGINRIGFDMGEFQKLATNASLNYKLNITLLMSHLACSDSPKHALNRKQLERFTYIKSLYPHLPASLANSSGIYLGKAYAFDLVRPGIALYGGNPLLPKKNPMKPVAHLTARVLQVRTLRKGETVGYSATWKAPRDCRIAVIAAGYRDGIPRKLSSSKPNGPAQVWLANRRCPIIGRVSMDMTCVDVTAAKAVREGDEAELFGTHISVDEAAGWADTISYELLTHLGSRYARLYSGQT
jgi:alanine racemase